jgi:hypothetical protein
MQGSCSRARSESRILRNDCRTVVAEGRRADEAAGEDDPAWGCDLHPRSLVRLIELYSATNKPDEAEKWQAEWTKYPEASLRRE